MLFFETRGETQELSHIGAIDRKGGSRQRARPERQYVDPRHAVGKALAVALEHIDVSQQVMREQHRLRSLQVRVPGHDHVEILPRRHGKLAL